MVQLVTLYLIIFEPAIYRAIIDDVVASIKNEFDAYGVGEDVLADLQSVCH
jgi:transcription initiation factor TFIIA large subunit